MTTDRVPPQVPLLLIESTGQNGASLLRTLCRLSLISQLLAAVLNAGLGGGRSAIILAAGATLAALALHAQHQDQPRRSAAWLTLSAWLTVTALTALGHGTHDEAMFAYPVVLVFGVLLLPRRSQWLLLLATVVWLVILGHGEITGWRSQATAQPSSLAWIANTIVALTATVLVGAVLVDRLVKGAAALQAAQTRLVGLIEKSPAAVIEWNADFRVREWSQSAERIFGHSRAQALGQHARFITPRERWELLDQLLERLRRNGGQGIDGVGPSLHANGSTLLCRWSFHTLTDGQGQDIGLASFAEDVTAELAAQQALRDSEQRRSEFLSRQFEVAGEFMRSNALREADPQAALRAITQGAQRVLGVARASIWMFDEESQQLRCGDEYAAESGHSSGRLLDATPHPAYVEALRSQRVIAANDARSDLRTASLVLACPPAEAAAAMLDVPVLQQGRLSAVLCLEHRGSPRRWSADEQAFAATLSDHLLIVLETSERLKARAEAAQAVARSDALFSSIFEESPLPMAVVSIDEGPSLVEVNQAFVLVSGYPREALIGRPTGDVSLWSKASHEQLRQELQRHGRVSNQEVMITTAAGQQRELLVSARQRLMGERERVFWYAVDVTDMRNVQRQFEQLNASLEAKVDERTEQLNRTMNLLRKAEQAAVGNLNFLRTVADNIPSLIAYYDNDQVCRFVNRAVELYNGKTREQVLGHHIRDRIPDAAWDNARGNIEAALAGQQRRFESSTVRPDGTVQFLEVLYIPDWVEGQVSGFFVRIDDITERKHSEQKILALNRDLQDRLQQLGAAMDDLQRTQVELVRTEKLSALGALVAGVAHELNTPIGNALTVASTMDDKTRDFCREVDAGQLRRSSLTAYTEASRQASQLVLRNLTVAGELVRSFKQVAVDQTSAQRRRFHLSDTLEEVLITLRHQLKPGHVALHTEIGARIELDSYPGPLGQVITNLFNNALAHAFEPGRGGTIRIETRPLEGSRVEIQFADDGLGVSDEHMPQLFNPFFTTKLGRGGSGLGLNIVHNIVTSLLGGRISVESRLGQGTRFVLVLPLQAPLIEHSAGSAVAGL